MASSSKISEVFCGEDLNWPLPCPPFGDVCDSQLKQSLLAPMDCVHGDLPVHMHALLPQSPTCIVEEVVCGRVALDHVGRHLVLHWTGEGPHGT